MNPAERETLRLSLLRYLDANAGNRRGLAETVMRQRFTNEGGTATPVEVAAELDYLADKGLVEVTAKPISPELRAWKITSAGRDHFAQQEP